MMRTLGLCAVLLWAAAHVDASGQAARGSAKIGACSLLPPKAELKRMLNSKNIAYDYLKPDEDVLPSGGTECTYGDVTVGLDLFTRAKIDELHKSAGAKWTPFSGVGDAAYLHDNAGRSTRWAELYIISDPHVVTIQLSVDSLQEPIESVKPRLLELARAMLAKLR